MFLAKMHCLTPKKKQGQANMEQNLHSIKVTSQKAEYACENKVSFLFMLLNYFYAYVNQVHDCALFFIYY
jgi:hypothetical protein